VAVGEDLPGVGLSGFERERDALFGEVDVKDLDVYLVADRDDLTRVIDVLPTELRDVMSPSIPPRSTKAPKFTTEEMTP